MPRKKPRPAARKYRARLKKAMAEAQERRPIERHIFTPGDAAKTAIVLGLMSVSRDREG